MDARLMFPSEYVAAADVIAAGKDVTVTMAGLERETLRGSQGTDEWCWVLHFTPPHKKRLVLKPTNTRTIMNMHGTETDDWQGKQITLYATTCMAFGDPNTDCIRIRDQVPRD